MIEEPDIEIGAGVSSKGEYVPPRSHVIADLLQLSADVSQQMDLVVVAVAASTTVVAEVATITTPATVTASLIRVQPTILVTLRLRSEWNLLSQSLQPCRALDSSFLALDDQTSSHQNTSPIKS